ncbi:MAG TPA: 7-carboxy-7-deazaguanine synthase QueE [Campylobacteraceae bacterium]|nr:7-carboxy-7-deazaguanine synthase QueE [Campylobacteraceae bacterium]
MLKVSSIFYSIQGEGTHAGIASIFVRLYGCNLTCDFCDDELHKTTLEEMKYEEVLARIAAYPAKRVIITGGEPSIYDLNPFITFLHRKGYYVSIETNGYDFANVKKADWITYSPKDWDDVKKEGFDEMKFIVDKRSPIEKLLKIESVRHIFLQPQNYMHTPNMENVHYCVELVERYPQKFRLSLQMHKFIGVD